MRVNYNNIFAPESPLLVYIASDVRSGSTLLDLILGGHPKIASVGEIQFLMDHFRQEGTGYSWDWRCTCGKHFTECPFWAEVNNKIENDTGKPIRSLETWVKRSGQFFPFMVLSNGGMNAFRSTFPSLQRGLSSSRNCWKIINVVHKITEKDIIIDSSKIAEQFRFLYYWRPKAMRMIYLVRDGRGVLYSKMTRAGDSARKASKTWVLENIKILAIKSLIPKHQSISIKYEELCKDPQYTFDRISRFLKIPQEKIRFSKSSRHNVGGSPHRFDKTNTDIKLDERWKYKLSAKDRKVFSFVCGWLNRLLGYK